MKSYNAAAGGIINIYILYQFIFIFFFINLSSTIDTPRTEDVYIYEINEHIILKLKTFIIRDFQIFISLLELLSRLKRV